MRNIISTLALVAAGGGAWSRDRDTASAPSAAQVIGPKSIRLLFIFASATLLTLFLLQQLVQASGDNQSAMLDENGILIRITTASDASRSSGSPDISADGTRVAFSSDSDFRNQGIADNQFEIWLYDTATMTLTRITTATDEMRDSGGPAISADASRIAFVGDSDLLGQGILDDQTAVWVYDTQTMTFTRLALVLDSMPHDERDAGALDLNADGNRVVFHSNSSLLGSPVTQYEIWLYDMSTMTLTRITTASEAGRSSVYPRLNSAGTQITFSSDSDFLNQGIPYGQFEVWLYDTTAMTFTRITTTPGGDSVAPSISQDGSHIVFNSDADFLGNNAGYFEVWLYDRSTMTYTRITTSDFPRDSWSYFPEISGDGATVAFVSDSDFLGEDAVQDQYRFWLYDLTGMTYTLIPDTGGGFGSAPMSLSEDGIQLAFSQGTDVWLYKQVDLKHKYYLPMLLRFVQ